MNDQEINYYSRQILLNEIGIAGQERLKSSRVLVIGAGGLACPLLQYLVGAGVGCIGIIDGDKVDVSNLHRQTLYGYSSVGKMKVEAAKERLTDLNPFIEIVIYPAFLEVQNASIISDFDIVVDCTDNYPTRFMVNDACFLYQKPLVYGSIYRYEGQVCVFNFEDGPTYRCLFPEMPNSKSSTNCVDSGVVGILPGIIGLFQANEVLKMITGIGTVLSGKLMLYNALNNSFNMLEINRKSCRYYKDLLVDNKLNQDNYIQACNKSEIEIFHINEDELFASNDMQNLFLLDVRENHEIPKFMDKQVLQIPLSTLTDNLPLIPLDKTIVVFCKSGIRSEKAIEIIIKNTSIKNLFNLKGGITNQIINQWKMTKKQ